MKEAKGAGERGLRLAIPRRPRGPLGSGHCLELREGEGEARDYEYVPEFLECV